MQNKTNNIPIKPLALRKRDADLAIRRAINATVAANELPMFELEDILLKYYVEVQRGAEKERRESEISYNRQLAEYQKRKAEEEKEVADDGGNLDRQSDA